MPQEAGATFAEPRRVVYANTVEELDGYYCQCLDERQALLKAGGVRALHETPPVGVVLLVQLAAWLMQNSLLFNTERVGLMLAAHS